MRAAGLVRRLAHRMQDLRYRCDLYRSRRRLAELTDEQLFDVGLTREQVDAETSRPFFED